MSLHVTFSVDTLLVLCYRLCIAIEVHILNQFPKICDEQYLFIPGVLSLAAAHEPRAGFHLYLDRTSLGDLEHIAERAVDQVAVRTSYHHFVSS